MELKNFVSQFDTCTCHLLCSDFVVMLRADVSCEWWLTIALLVREPQSPRFPTAPPSRHPHIATGVPFQVQG